MAGEVRLDEVERELGVSAFAALKRGHYTSARTECRITTSRQENEIAWLCEIGVYLAVWIPNEAVPSGADYVSRLSQFSPLGFDVTVHRWGTLKRPIYLSSDLQRDEIVTLGSITPLPPHAILPGGYDVGDTVVILEGQRQGDVCTVRSVDGDTYSLVSASQWVGDHLGKYLAAVVPGGDYGRYEEIQPGNVRYPPGTRVVYAGEPGYVVMTWRRGLAELYRLNQHSLRAEDVITAEKAHLRAE